MRMIDEAIDPGPTAPKAEKTEIEEEVDDEMSIGSLRPAKLVEELDRYVVGQHEAKRAIAIALRNRWRKKKIADEEMRKEIIPHNILMIGPTGVGKTEIARRIAKLTNAPFLKVEATKFTEVGYVGQDIESIIRNALEVSISLTKVRMRTRLKRKARKRAEDRIIIALVGETASAESKEKFLRKFKSGELDDKDVEITVLEQKQQPQIELPSGFDSPGSQIGMVSLGELLGKNAAQQHKNVKLKVADAYKQLINEELELMLDRETIIREAIHSLENEGIIFIDEIDKIASKEGSRRASGSGVSREGVQRDLLPIVEGSIVNTKHGPIDTRHILFIAAGAFHEVRPSDLLPELQGRFPVVVNLSALNKDDMMKILTDPKHSLTKQYKALLTTEGVEVVFDESGIERLASIAIELNTEVENIGARRLHTVLEKMFEDLNYNAGDDGADITSPVVIDSKYVDKNLEGIFKRLDYQKFVL